MSAEAYIVMSSFFLMAPREIVTAPFYFAKEMGKYWEDFVTEGRGNYWNVNANADHYEKMGRGAIGVISWNDTDKIENLKKYVVGYLCKMDQYFSPKWGHKLRLFRRGDFPDIPDIKRGRPRKASESNADDPLIPN